MRAGASRDHTHRPGFGGLDRPEAATAAEIEDVGRGAGVELLHRDAAAEAGEEHAMPIIAARAEAEAGSGDRRRRKRSKMRRAYDLAGTRDAWGRKENAGEEDAPDEEVFVELDGAGGAGETALFCALLGEFGLDVAGRAVLHRPGYGHACGGGWKGSGVRQHGGGRGAEEEVRAVGGWASEGGDVEVRGCGRRRRRRIRRRETRRRGLDGGGSAQLALWSPLVTHLSQGTPHGSLFSR